jgi:hypothetical protein
MKKQISILAAIVFVAVQFWGCSNDGGISGSIKGSGNIVEIEYNYDDFEKIIVSDAFELSVLQSDTFYIKLMVDDNLANYVNIFSNGGWLVIGMVDGHNYNNALLKAEVYMPILVELEGSGASVVTSGSFNDSTDFRLELSGASVFTGTMAANSYEVILSGASVVNISGTCENFYIDASGASIANVNGTCSNQNIDASGASVFNMGNFSSIVAIIELSGAADATISVSEHLDAILKGASVLKYYGDPFLGDISIDGASVLTKL